MVFSVQAILEHLSAIMTLEPGDVIAPAPLRASGSVPARTVPRSRRHCHFEIDGLAGSKPPSSCPTKESPHDQSDHPALPRRPAEPGRQAARSYYTEVVSLTPYDEVDGVVFLASGGYGPAVELRPGDTAGLDHVGFEVSGTHEDELLARLRHQSVSVRTSDDSEPGLSRVHEVQDVEGNRLQLCVVDQRRASAGRASAESCPTRSDTSQRGRGVPRRSPSSTSRRSAFAGRTGWATSSCSCAATAITTRSTSSTLHGPASCTTSRSSSATARSC